MNRNQFIGHPLVDSFLDFFASCLSNLEVSYLSGFKHLLPAHRHFHITGVQAALNSYAWPGVDTLAPFPHPAIYDWPTTSGFLGRTRHALQLAIANGNEPLTRDIAIKILEWGLNPNGVNANVNRLDQVTQNLGITWHQYFANVRNAINLATVDTNNITELLIPYASSGTSKIHSLASTDGLVIYDSRVAAMVGECINEFLRRAATHQIPDILRILVELNHGRTTQRRPTPLLNGSNHRGFTRDYRWIECQVRVSWLFEEVLIRTPAIFQGLPLQQRMHQLEAACFMMGAYLVPGPFSGRTFNFANV